MIFNTIQEAKKKVKYNIKSSIMDYKDNLVNKFKETLKMLLIREKRK